MIMYLASLKSVPEQLYEAASIDGATWWQRTRYITLPMMRNIIAITVLLSDADKRTLLGTLHQQFAGSGLRYWLTANDGLATTSNPGGIGRWAYQLEDLTVDPSP